MFKVLLVHMQLGLLCKIIFESIFDSLEFWIVDNSGGRISQIWLDVPGMNRMNELKQKVLNK